MDKFHNMQVVFNNGKIDSLKEKIIQKIINNATKSFLLIIIIQCKLMKYANPSISGVTYMDHFDFEDRYRDVYECDPFYWHPLHLPEHCAEMYEKALRSKITSTVPLRILKKKKQFIYSYEDMSREYPPLTQEREVIDIANKYYLKPLSPYEKILKYLWRDVMSDSKPPVIGLLPNFGPVAVYRQPISRKTEKKIKKMAQAYIRKKQKDFNEVESYYGHIDVKYPRKNNLQDSSEVNGSNNLTKSNKKMIFTKKTKNGGTITIKKYVE